ncbi:MAG: sigma 54-interacting transcriptional regulator [Myxococcota bacterium]
MSNEALFDDVRIERDFLARLLDLSEHESPAALVEEALALVAERSGAAKAYLEIGSRVAPAAVWRAVAGLEPERVEEVKRLLSSTIMREALESGRSVETASAAEDARFREAASIRRNRIEAVLCVPVGQPPVGVVYLQGHGAGGPFPAAAKAWTEKFARHLAPVARRLVASSLRDGPDATAPFRARLNGSEALLGRGTALAEVLRLAATVAGMEMPVLLTGPSGTGKSELARIIARSSRRASGPFVALNCAAIPDELIESELFGALPGAHSTATKRVAGKVEVAAGGTLFLDEVGELSLAAQAKMLQLLQDGTYWPLGGQKAMQADVRVIAATNANLGERVANRTFREDLFYRLDVVAIAMPPLSERRADIPLLAEALLGAQRDRHGLGPMTLSHVASQALALAEWPGNVRQLANTVLGAAVRAHAEGTQHIEAYHCFPAEAKSAGDRELVPWQLAMRGYQKQVLRDALAACQGNVTAAAQRLGIARSHAFELVKELGLREPG